jgi:nucleoside-diphosphate-sugar epimerase
VKRALVTGNLGFVGGEFVCELLERNYAVDGMDIKGQRDCRDFFAHQPDAHYDLVIHCAAVVGGRTMIDGSPLHLAAEDLSIDAELFRWALRAKPKRIVYFSSSAAYPPRHQRDRWRSPLEESDYEPGECDQTYGWVKQTGEMMAALLNDLGDTAVHVFRPFSGYGNDQALDYPFPSFIRRAAQREQPFDIWGRGDSARDWVHIDDIVGAVMAAIDQDVRGPVNICTGRATTFDELADMVMRRAGYETCKRYIGDAPQGVYWRVGDPTLLETFYKPRISLEEGIARALEAA